MKKSIAKRYSRDKPQLTNPGNIIFFTFLLTGFLTQALESIKRYRNKLFQFSDSPHMPFKKVISKFWILINSQILRRKMRKRSLLFHQPCRYPEQHWCLHLVSYQNFMQIPEEIVFILCPYSSFKCATLSHPSNNLALHKLPLSFSALQKKSLYTTPGKVWGWRIEFLNWLTRLTFHHLREWKHKWII